MPSARDAFVVRACVFAVVAALYFVRLGAGSLWDNSEPNYGEIVRELFATGNWLTLHFNFEPWYIHPPLWFWTAGAAVAAFGLNEFALRLPSAVFGLLAAWATYRAGRRLYGETTGVVAALALGSCLEFVVISRLAILDTMLTFFTTVAFFWSFFAVRDGDRRAFWIAVVAAALGTLTKGPIAIVLPVVVLAVWCSWTNAWSRLRTLPWAGGAALFVVLAGSWFAVATWINGPGFLAAYFGISTVGRFLSPFQNQPGPWWYYLPILVIGFFPYVAFLPKAVKEAWLTRGQDEKFLLSYSLVPLVFFSIAQTKLPNYVALLFPALAVLTGSLLGNAIAQNRLRPLRGALLMLPASLILLVIGLVLYGKSQNPGPFLALIPTLALLGWIVVPLAVATALVTLALNRAWLAPVGLALMMTGFVFVSAIDILPRVEAFKPMKGIAETVMARWRPTDKLGTAGVSGAFSLLFYTGQPLTPVGEAAGELTSEEFMRQPARVFFVIAPDEYRRLAAEGIRIIVLKREPKLLLVTNRT